MKTNKAYAKRIKVTKNGKLKTRSLGQCHYNARETGSAKRAKRGSRTIMMSAKLKQRFLPNSPKLTN